jgi:hypothetical protein
MVFISIWNLLPSPMSCVTSARQLRELSQRLVFCFGGLFMKNSTILFFSLMVLVAGCGKQANTVQSLTGQGIIGGEEVKTDDPVSKSVVAIYDTKQGGLCTGSIISADLIVTAAHCAQGQAADLKIIFGLDIQDKDHRTVLPAESLTFNPRYTESMNALNKLMSDLETEEMASNPAYDPSSPSPDFLKKIMAAADAYTDWGDIALIKLKGALPAGYVPAKLLDKSETLQNAGLVTLAGYGITHGKVAPPAPPVAAPAATSPASGPSYFLKKMGLIPQMSFDASAMAADRDSLFLLRKVAVAIKDAAFSKSEVLLDQTAGKGACHGDSGGPAYSKNAAGELYLWGVTSRGIHDPGDTCGGDSAYTNILDHKAWLQTAAKAMNGTLPN